MLYQHPRDPPNALGAEQGCESIHVRRDLLFVVPTWCDSLARELLGRPVRAKYTCEDFLGVGVDYVVLNNVTQVSTLFGGGQMLPYQPPHVGELEKVWSLVDAIIPI